MNDIYKRAREVFNTYASIDEPHLPVGPMSAIQVKMFRWAMKNVKHTLPYSTEGVLGVVEESGELMQAVGRLAHLELNASQGRRGYDKDVERLRAEMADAIGDIGMFLLHVSTANRLDLWTILSGVAEKVTQRDWIKNPENAHEL